ncbi:MAG TPA: ABC transporter permease [Nitrososphaerales archaeon]|nr:ABC transporter permease [Nitrososphaerales archaeon]
MVDIITSILAASIPLSMPILLAALGEVFAERSGVINMGIEGIMGLSAFSSLWVTFTTGSYVLGILTALGAAGILGLLHSFACIRIGVNQLIMGLLIFTLGNAIADFSYRRIISVQVPLVRPLQPIDVPFLSHIPYLGPILFSQNLLVYFAFALAFILGFVLYRTTWGLKIRSVGENPEAADSAGINVNLVRLICVVFGAMLAGIAGASLTLGYLGIYNTGDTIVAGRGWIALVVVIFSSWSPYRAILGSWIFGLGFSIAFTFIGIGSTFFGNSSSAPYFLQMIPYIFALAVIVIFRRGIRQPSALTVPYRRK